MNGLFITDQLQPCIWPHKHLIWAWKDWKQTTWSWNVLFSEKQPELIVTLIFRLPPPARITRTRWYHTVRATSIHIRTDLSQRPLALCRINQPPFTLCPPHCWQLIQMISEREKSFCSSFPPSYLLTQMLNIHKLFQVVPSDTSST